MLIRLRVTPTNGGQDEAFAVVQKAAASPSVTLVRHKVFMEGLMGVLTGRLSAKDFVEWLADLGGHRPQPFARNSDLRGARCGTAGIDRQSYKLSQSLNFSLDSLSERQLTIGPSTCEQGGPT